MKTFAFLFNPINIRHIKEFWPLTRIMPDFFVKSFLKNQGFKISPVKKFKSALGKEIQGYFIVAPLLPEQILELDQELVLDKIITAGFLAKDLGADILGLGGYASFMADRKPMIYKHLKIPVTSGTAFTAWSVVEALHRLQSEGRLDLKDSRLAIIGAANTLGSLCCRKMAQYVPHITLNAKFRSRVEALQRQVSDASGVRPEIEEDVNKAVRNADIVIVASSEFDPAVDIASCKSGAVVCDICLTRSVMARAHNRSDLLIVEGGIVRLPNEEHSGLHVGLPKDMVCASMAETMLLTFEEKFPPYSLGDSINVDKLEEIANLSVRHGFEVMVPGALSS